MEARILYKRSGNFICNIDVDEIDTFEDILERAEIETTIKTGIDHKGCLDICCNMLNCPHIM